MRKIVKDVLKEKGITLEKPAAIHVGGYFTHDHEKVVFTFDRLVMESMFAKTYRHRTEFPTDLLPEHPYIDELANAKDLPENLRVPVTKLLLIIKNDAGAMVVVWEISDEREIKKNPDPFSWQLPGTGGMEVNSFFGSAIEKFQEEQEFLGHETTTKTENFQPVDWLPGLSKIRFVDENGGSSKEEAVIILNDVKTEGRTSLVIVPAIMKGPLPEFDNKYRSSGMYGVFLDDLMRNQEFIKDNILRTLLSQHSELLKQLTAG